MVLLALIVVGMLSLSTVALRSSSRGDAQAIAKANARMALMIAIGKLQKHAGADTRITAPAGIANEAAPPLTGVWKSWQGSDHEASGRPRQPDYGSKVKKEADGGRFLAWLVSGSGPGDDPKNPSALVSHTPTASSVPLLLDQEQGAGKARAVHVVPRPVNGSGTYAWWVSGENQKAKLPIPYEPDDKNSAAQWSDMVRSHAVPDPEIFGLNASAPGYREMAEKSVTLPSVDFLPTLTAATPRPSFHDFSTSSIGLLTNTATGGWRKDLSLVTENWAALPDGLPFFRIEANTTTSVYKPSLSDPRAAQSILYPWSDYLGTAATYPLGQHGAVASWLNLVNHATAYKRITPSGSGIGSIPFARPHFFPIDSASVFDFLHSIRTSPAIARVHWVFSHRTTLVPGDPADPDDDTYTLQLLITPAITLWNPHNVSVTTPATGMKIKLVKSAPCALLYHNRDGTAVLPGRKMTRGAVNPGLDSAIANYPDMLFNTDHLEYNIAGGFTLLPGETRLFSASSAVTTAAVSMAPGYNPNGGHRRDINFIGPAYRNGDKVKLDIKFDNLINLGTPGCGVWIEVDNATGAFRNFERYIMSYTQETARRYWPEMAAKDLPSPPAQDLVGTWRPFFSCVFGARVASNTSLPARGMLQASPLVSQTTMMPGSNHPVNAAFDFSFFAHPLGGDDKLPNASNITNRGFIISGFQAGDGLSRIILNEFPTRPLLSLAELQNWNLRSYNPSPPFALNVIANSDATPLMPSNAVAKDASPQNLQHDDSYCANHLLFDDWFFSSIAPDPTNFGSAISRNIRNVYKDMLAGTKPLPNRSYRPIPEDQSLGGSDQDSLVTKILTTDVATSWQTIASRLEVDGMFNVNSTSLQAWRSLLGHARGQKIPHITEAAVSLSGATDHAHSRYGVAGDVIAGAMGMSGGFPEASEITGYRVFDDAQLDLLAEEMVKQVRLRGPFLSLSEFVNRQLSDYKDLALAGAIQTALNRMSERAGANDPLKVLKNPDLSQDAGTPADPKLVGADYVFPEAAVGKSTYGLPGWIRQADVLRPLAPILSVRDDTFTIRTYGDARDKAGNIIARTWCEATVRRTRGFVDPSDLPDITNPPTNPANAAFGRRFEIVAFRWLSPDEV